MPLKNRYQKCSKLSEPKFREILKYFAQDLTTSDTASLKRDNKVYTEIVSDASKAFLIKVIRGHISIDSIIHTDGWRGYNGLVDVGYAKHFRVHHGNNGFVNGNRHMNSIESFWSYAKRRLVKFKGIPQETFLLHLKEAEFCFNLRNENLYKVLLNLLGKRPL